MEGGPPAVASSRDVAYNRKYREIESPALGWPDEHHDQNEAGGRAADEAHRRGNPRDRFARKAGRRDREGDLPGLARPSGDHFPGPEAEPGRPDPRHELFRR